MRDSFDSEKENANREIMRALIAVEVLLRTDLLPAKVYEDTLKDELDMLRCNEITLSPEIAVKSKKISLLINGLTKHAEE